MENVGSSVDSEISKNGTDGEELREKIEKKRSEKRFKNKTERASKENGGADNGNGAGNGNENGNGAGNGNENGAEDGYGPNTVNFEQEYQSLGNEEGKSTKSGKSKKAGKFRTGNTGKKKKLNDDVINAMGLSIYAFHTVIAAALKTPELAISSEQSESLSKALAGLDEVYNIVIPAKTIALGNFLITAIGIYAPIGISIIRRKKQEKNENTINYDKVSG